MKPGPPNVKLMGIVRVDVPLVPNNSVKSTLGFSIPSTMIYYQLLMGICVVCGVNLI